MAPAPALASASLFLAGLSLFAQPPSGAPAAATDQYGDSLPAGSVARLGTVRWRHGGVVSFAAMSGDAKTVVTAAEDNVVRVWEYPSGRELRRIGEATSAEPQTGRAVAGRVFYRSGALPAAISKDGKSIAVNFDGNAKVYEVATGKLVLALQTSNQIQRFVTAMAFSPDGKHLATIEYDNTIRLWDVTTGKSDKSFGGPGVNGNVIYGGNAALVYSPDGKMIATPTLSIVNGMVAYRISVWDPDKGTEIQSISANQNAGVFNPVFSPDSKKLAYSHGDGAISIVEPATGKEINRLKLNVGMASAIFASTSDKLYVRPSLGRSVREIDAATGKELRKLGSQTPASGSMYYYGVNGQSLSLSPDNTTLILMGSDHHPHFIDVATGKLLDDNGAMSDPLTAIGFAADGKKLLTHSADGMVRYWESATGKLLEKKPVPARGFGSFTSPDGKYQASFTSGLKRGVTVREIGGGKTIAQLPAPERDYNAFLTFAPDSKSLTLRWPQEQKLEIFELPSGKKLHAVNISTGMPQPDALVVGPTKIAPNTTFYSDDSRYLASFADPNTFAVWELATGKRMLSLALPGSAIVNDGAFSPDTRTLALDAGQGQVTVYELATGSIRRTFGRPTAVSANNAIGGMVVISSYSSPAASSSGNRVAYSADGKSLMFASIDRAVYLWDIASGAELKTLQGHNGQLVGIAVSPDGRLLASASTDTTALVWDLTKLEKAVVPTAKAMAADETWQALAASDASKAVDAMAWLVGAPATAVQLIEERLKPAPSLDAALVQELIQQLGDNQYKVRQKATLELHKMGERVVPALEKALAGDPPLEMKNRLADLYGKLSGPVLQGDALRGWRAVEVLEKLGTPSARRLLRSLADGATGASVTVSAQRALQRMKDDG
jgi:WD40 repeat protein